MNSFQPLNTRYELACKLQMEPITDEEKLQNKAITDEEKNKQAIFELKKCADEEYIPL